MFFRSPTAANPTWRITPRRIQVALGAFWILDGALQLQPYFFSNEFIGTMIQSMAGGQPAAVAGPIFFMVSRIQPFHVYWNAAFAVIQFGIGLGLINSVRTARLALAVSFVWTLIVWWFGEGLGMLAMGMANPMTGAPGAVLLYAAVGILVWPSDRPPNPVAAAAGYSGDMAGRAIWSLLWFGFAGLMLLPVNRGADSFATILTVAAIQSPGPLAALDNSLAHLLGGDGLIAAIMMAAAMAIIGAGVWLDRPRNLFLILGSILAMSFWVTTEFLGGILTGQGTDPNTGPLIVLLGVCVGMRRERWFPGAPDPPRSPRTAGVE